MTTKERLHKLIDELSEAEAERALALVEGQHKDRPDGIVDEWGNLDAQTDAAAGDLMQRLDDEEIAEFGETISQAWGYESPK
jgi:hypothetical protein